MEDFDVSVIIHPLAISVNTAQIARTLTHALMVKLLNIARIRNNILDVLTHFSQTHNNCDFAYQLMTNYL